MVRLMFGRKWRSGFISRASSNNGIPSSRQCSRRYQPARPNEITFGTQEVFSWRPTDINLQVDWLSRDSTSYYDSHDGPVAWYADTLHAASPGVQAPVSLSPFQLTAAA